MKRCRTRRVANPEANEDLHPGEEPQKVVNGGSAPPSPVDIWDNILVEEGAKFLSESAQPLVTHVLKNRALESALLIRPYHNRIRTEIHGGTRGARSVP